MDLNQRIRHVRNSLKYSQKNFAEKLGLTQAGISWMEQSGKNVADQNIRLICTLFNVNEDWLRNGEGEIFLTEDANMLHELAQKYELTKSEEHFMDIFLKLNKKEREIMVKCMTLMTNNEEEYSVRRTTPKPDSKKSTKEKRRTMNDELDAEEKHKMSSAFIGTNGLYTKRA